MTFPNFWGALNWAMPVAILLLVALSAVVWSYFVSNGSSGLKVLLGCLKFGAIGLLAICLLEPMN